MLQYSTKVQNARLNAIETEIGPAPRLDIFDAVQSPDCAAAPAGNLIASGNLPSDWMAAAAAGVVGKTGTWTVTGVLSGGTARGFRIHRSGSPSECDIQGTAGPTGSPTYDMGLDNVSISNGQVVTVTAFNITSGNR